MRKKIPHSLAATVSPSDAEIVCLCVCKQSHIVWSILQVQYIYLYFERHYQSRDKFLTEISTFGELMALQVKAKVFEKNRKIFEFFVFLPLNEVAVNNFCIKTL